MQGTRAERMARYKEERRKQLASQFAPLSEPPASPKRRLVQKDPTSSSEEPRTTRASRLRAAATSQDASNSSSTKANKEKPNGADSQRSNKLERDKSGKRKSNLNRALNSEEAPQMDIADDTSNRRRRRRFFPPEILQQAAKDLTLSNSTTTPGVPSTAAPTTRTTPNKKSELSVHMENARKGQLPSYSEMGKTAVSPKRPKERSPKLSEISLDNNSSIKLANKENVKSNIRSSKLPVPDNEQPLTKQRRSINISRKMDELTALTHETLARVERLTNKNHEAPGEASATRKSSPTPKSKPLSAYEGPTKDSSKIDSKADTRVPLICDSSKLQTHSILKKKFIDEPYIDVIHSSPISAPVSILKRKVSQDEFRSQGCTPPTHTPPVTFSPNVVDPATNRKKQGILKKRRSLDEAQVLRHRSCSPNGKSDSRSILKNQRRSSLEELVRTQSPEAGLHGILKRRASRHDDEIDPPINSPEPHGILKRKSGTNSAGSNSPSPHISIATAVILAAAGGAEIVLESLDAVKPILKKKSFSDEQPSGDYSANEVPKPILKKKSSTDTDDYDDKPKRPILKNTKSSFEETEKFYQKSGDDSSECEVRPILKQSSSRENSPRPRLSFYSDDFSESTSENGNGNYRQQQRSRRIHVVCSDFINKNSMGFPKDEDRDLHKPRPLSVCDMVLNIEKRLSTGAIPKKSTPKRHGERYRTQPVTYHELEASRNSVQVPFYFDLPTPNTQQNDNSSNNAHSLLDLTTSFDADNNLSSFLSSSLPNTTFDSVISGKMSADSAFQSLGDGLELENEEKPASPIPPKPSVPEPARLQMKALAEEAKNIQLKRGGGSAALKQRIRTDQRPNSARFSTQPVTLGEVEEASKIKKETVEAEVDFKLDKNDPARLSISEKIKLLSQNLQEDKGPKPRPRCTRFQTQPITLNEVQTAHTQNFTALETNKEDGLSQKERKGILKSKAGEPRMNRISPRFQESLKSVLKKNEPQRKAVEKSPKGLRSILKQEVTDFALDEGISSDESESSSETENCVKISDEKECVGDKRRLRKADYGASDSNQTSDGDSSGGREVRSIIGGDWRHKRARERHITEGLLKSKSQGLVRDEEEIKSNGVRRSLTQSAMPKTIAELQAKLQKSGDNEWRKRIPKLNSANEELSLLNVKNIYNEELSEKSSILSVRKDELDAASKQWKNRVEQSDAVNFSVAGRMQQENDVPTIPINIPIPDKLKRTPKAKTFKGREGGDVTNETCSTPVSPEKNNVSSGFKRSISLPGAGDTDPATADDASLKASSRKVTVDRPDNITFTSFFESVDAKRKSETSDISIDDFDSVARQTEALLVQKRTVRVQRRREASKNPIKALAARPDVKDEYTEVITGIAEREKHRLNIEKLAKNSNFAVEALAGLASKEDFSSVALKRSSSTNSTYPPFKDVMLLQVKGRRYVQTRLAEPVASSINDGDCFILVTSSAVYNYIGPYANVIEQSRAADIVNSIQRTGDLGCKCDKVVTINPKKIGSCSSTDLEKFWKLLAATKEIEITQAGHPDEDEIYESSMLSTNMIYEYKNEELVPFNNYWGTVPKIEMLNPLKTFVFDFGSEMYVWSGKNALLEDKRKALKLAKELWNEGYNYTECGVNPVGIASVLGIRRQGSTILKENSRPKWALFAKITQHRETVLFKEKFLDWPDYSRVIRVKQSDKDKIIEAKFNFQPIEIKTQDSSEPDLEVDGLHLGRGESFFDDETNRLFNFTTKSVTSWVILEYSHEQLADKSVGQFYEGNSYIVRWEYCANITGRELSGKPSKFVQAGRDHCLYFCWQGSEATVNEKGAAALLTIQLDSENARQIRVLQGSEPPVFLNLFNGRMVIHKGKQEKPNKSDYKLYICRGEMKPEAFLTEVPCSMRSLRSRASFILINCKSGDVIVWNGVKALEHTKLRGKEVAENVVESQLSEFGFADDCDEFSLEINEEGSESNEFLSALGKKRQLYMNLLKSGRDFDYMPRLFYLTSISGNFEAAEMLCPHRSKFVTSYPFLQSDLYSANQPALFMLDNGHEVWLWQGWWPELENDQAVVDQTGSGAVRWQAERKAAMQTVVNYCKQQSQRFKNISAYLVWAGLEPLAFTNLFPFWRDCDDVAELNIQDGKKAGEAIQIEKELALLTRSTYPLDQLLQRPLPDGVDPTHLENYLSPEDFSELMSMTLEEFHKLPAWKQTSVKKEKGLF